MAYRSGPPRGGHIEGLDELEAKLRRGVRRRRMVMGFLSLVTGIGMVVTGTMMSVSAFRALRMSIAMVLFGVLLVGLAFVILRIGEIREGEGLEIHERDPIPWSTLGGVSAGILVVTALIAAYPLGVYRWAGTLRSPCRKVFTPADAKALGVATFTVGHVTSESSMCTMTGLEGDRRVLQVALTKYPSGDDRELVERPGEFIVTKRRGSSQMRVHLASRLYDRDAALRIAKHLEASTWDGKL